MEQVAHQCIAVQYLLELSKQLDIDPRGCISSFFTRHGNIVVMLQNVGNNVCVSLQDPDR